MHVGIVTNPHSRKNRKNPDKIHRLTEVTREFGNNRALLRQTRELVELPQVAREFLDAGIKVLCVDGGDGTLHYVLNQFHALCRERNLPLPLILPLKGGTINGIAVQNGNRRNAVQALARLLQIANNGAHFRTIPCQLIAVNGRIGFGFASGGATRGLEDYYRVHDSGPSTVFKIIAKLGMSSMTGTGYAKRLFQPEHYRGAIDGQPFEGDYSIIFAGAIREIGLGCRMLYRYNEEPGTFHIRGFSVPPLQFFMSLPRIWTGHRLARDCSLDHVARSAVLEFQGLQRYVLDGEFFTARNRITFSVGPVVQLLQV